jgi:hypothetical protein
LIICPSVIDRSTGLAGRTLSSTFAARFAVISLGIPPGTNSTSSACNRHAVRVRELPSSLLRFAKSRNTAA